GSDVEGGPVRRVQVLRCDESRADFVVRADPGLLSAASCDRRAIELLSRYFAAITKRDLIEIRAELAALPAPTLVLWGNADGFFPMAMAHWLRDHLAAVTEVVELDGERAFWPEERPAFLNDRLRAHW